MTAAANNRPRVAVIGAGMTGVTCARGLKAAGYDVTLLDKGRGPGGRLSTRRTETGAVFDHGAQYIMPQGEAFRTVLMDLVESGQAALWKPSFADSRARADGDWIVGLPGMNGVIKAMADGLDLATQARVERAIRDEDGWRLITSSNAEMGPYDIVVSTIPAPQAAHLFGPVAGPLNGIDDVKIAPTWTLLLGFAEHVGAPFDVWWSFDHTLAFAARMGSKPGRSELPDCWTVHAGSVFSRCHLEEEEPTVREELIGAFKDLIGNRLPVILYAAAHRWRYATTISPLGEPFMARCDDTLYIAGDWCLGSGIEAAFESGAAVAQVLR